MYVFCYLCVYQVNLPDRLEKEIVDLISQEHQNRKSLGVLSKRITTKKLTDIYNSLSNAGFSQRQVESAMSATVAMGGDLHDALDWLCLNTPNDQLPKGFSQTLQAEEEKKSKPKFDTSQQQDATSGPAPTIVPAVPVKEKQGLSPAPQKEAVKDWILRYAEQSSESSGDDKDKEEEEDPNSRYLILTARLEDAKAEAADAKQKGNKAGHTKTSKKVRELMLGVYCITVQPALKTISQ
ncbi:hypothetical protein V1264_007618 [Littorina saxatilis]|uniref:ATP-dependent RNA helicase DHX29-like UBA domain-containing protein n=1 Tax=Littorina saxatilis TaxID=31220 RepID=A0AAN9AWU3_9CAEN